MPKKKKTKATKKRVPRVYQQKKYLGDTGSIEDDSLEMEKPKDDRMTLEEAIEWFRADPHPEHFISLDKPGSAIAHGNIYIQFKDGDYITSDPVEVEILLRSKLPFAPLNPKLRNLKK